jgi:hypothetical protein
VKWLLVLVDKLHDIMSRDFHDPAWERVAVAEIEVACAALAEHAAATAQLADLADAIDAYGECNYGVAAALARAATHARHKVSDFCRPNSASLSLQELCKRFNRLRRQPKA